MAVQQHYTPILRSLILTHVSIGIKRIDARGLDDAWLSFNDTGFRVQSPRSIAPSLEVAVGASAHI